MANEPVTVIIPFCQRYTPRELLTEALESVEAQSVPTESIVIEEDDPQGPAWARNQGMDQADTRYVAFLDADDRWHENKLECQLDALQRFDVGMCIERRCSEQCKVVDTDEFIRSLLFGNLGSLTSSIVIDTVRTDCRFCEDIDRLEDHLFMIESALDAGVCACDEPLVYRRKHEKGLTARGTARQTYESRLAVANRINEYPDTEPYSDKLRQLAHTGFGRALQVEGDHKRSMQEFLRALQYRLAPRPFAAICLSPLYILRDVLNYPLPKEKK